MRGRSAPGWRLLPALLALGGCDGDSGPRQSTRGEEACDTGGLVLPPGFCAEVWADQLGYVRHLAVRANGDVYGSLRHRGLEVGGVVALRDADGDGRAERVESFGEAPTVGLRIAGDLLYGVTEQGILRWQLPPQGLLPAAAPEELVRFEPSPTDAPAAHGLAIAGDGALLVTLAAGSNACEARPGEPGSPGLRPCPHRQWRAGLWRFAADRPGQRQASDGERLVSGLRYAIGLDLDPRSGVLWALVHGRDGLSRSWPGRWTAADDLQRPGDELLRLEQGQDYGWPWCFWDPPSGRRVPAPEYPSLGEADCEAHPPPVLGLPAHATPNDLLFLRREAFPAPWREGVYVALGGPFPGGAGEVEPQVAFLPFANGAPSGPLQRFAGGFAGTSAERSGPYRPVGLAEGPAGELYVVDATEGRLWRIRPAPPKR